MISIDLTGKNALITGGTRGIGRAISLTLARAGASTASLYRADASAAEKTLAELKLVGPNAEHIAVQGDISSQTEAERGVAELIASIGSVDILILNAAAGAGGPMVEMTTQEWKRAFEANVHGGFYVVKACAPHLRRGGTIIFISSGAGHDPLLNSSSYGASKAAVNHMAACLAQEIGPQGIRVNVVSPGRTFTGDGDPNADPDKYTVSERETVDGTALRRLGTAQDVADVVLFFASDLSGFITGQWVRVNGGRV